MVRGADPCALHYESEIEAHLCNDVLASSDTGTRSVTRARAIAVHKHPCALPQELHQARCGAGIAAQCYIRHGPSRTLAWPGVSENVVCKHRTGDVTRDGRVFKKNAFIASA